MTPATACLRRVSSSGLGSPTGRIEGSEPDYMGSLASSSSPLLLVRPFVSFRFVPPSIVLSLLSIRAEPEDWRERHIESATTR